MRFRPGPPGRRRTGPAPPAVPSVVSSAAVSWRGPIPWLGGLAALYLAAPIGALLFHLGPATWAGMGAPGLLAALGVSAATATVSTALIALCGVPLAYALARGGGPGAAILGVLVQLPLALPPLASGILLLFLVGPYTPLGRLTHGALTDSPAGIVLAQTFVAAPFLLVAARSAFAAVGPGLEDVAATLGHGRWGRFARTALPEAWAGIRAGLLLAWVRAFGEFGATVTVAYHPYSLPVYTFVQFGGTGLPAALPPVALAVAAAAVFLVLSLPRRGRRGRDGAPAGTEIAPWAGAAPGAFLPWTLRESGTEPGASGAGAPVPPADAGGADLLARPGGSRTATAGPAVPAVPDLAFHLVRRLGSFRLEAGFGTAGCPVDGQAGGARRLVLLGPSGSGKSLTLRLLAGLDRADAGFVRLGARDLTALPPERRGVGYVPQDYGLPPRLPVGSQVAAGAGVTPAEARLWLARMGLEGLERRLPAELSGGQRQRVALARALALTPRLLLLDEPFSALDAPVRERLRRELRALQPHMAAATVVVTHDPHEAALLGDAWVVLSAGRVLQAGAAEAVRRRPASPDVARLLGIANVLRGRAAGPSSIAVGGILLRLPPARLPAERAAGGLRTGEPVAWAIRAEDVRLDPRGAWPARVEDVVGTGAGWEAALRLEHGPALLARGAGEAPEAGAAWRVDLPGESVLVWPEDRPPAAAPGGPGAPGPRGDASAARV